MQLDWDAIWQDFEEWFTAENKESKCEHCLLTDFSYATWEHQQKAIKRIVNKHVKRLLKEA